MEALRTILRLLLSRGVKAEVEKSLLPTKFRFSIFPDALADKLYACRKGDEHLHRSHGNTMQVALPGPGEGHRDCEWFVGSPNVDDFNTEHCIISLTGEKKCSCR